VLFVKNLGLYFCPHNTVLARYMPWQYVSPLCSELCHNGWTDGDRFWHGFPTLYWKRILSNFVPNVDHSWFFWVFRHGMLIVASFVDVVQPTTVASLITLSIRLCLKDAACHTGLSATTDSCWWCGWLSLKSNSS